MLQDSREDKNCSLTLTLTLTSSSNKNRRKQGRETKNKKQIFSKETVRLRKSAQSDPMEEESLRWEAFVKHVGFKPRMKERESYE